MPPNCNTIFKIVGYAACFHFQKLWIILLTNAFLHFTELVGVFYVGWWVQLMKADDFSWHHISSCHNHSHRLFKQTEKNVKNHKMFIIFWWQMVQNIRLLQWLLRYWHCHRCGWGWWQNCLWNMSRYNIRDYRREDKRKRYMATTTKFVTAI